MTVYADIATDLTDHVGLIEIRKPPHNFFDVSLINQIADALAAFDANPACRAVVLAAQGKAFCAGADFANRPDTGTVSETEGVVVKHLYKEAVRIFRSKKPIIAAVHGPAIGGALAGTFSAPYAAYHFGQIQLYYVVANMAAVPITAFLVMPAGLLALMLMPLHLEYLALIPMGWGVSAIIWIGRSVSAWPDATLGVPHLAPWGLAVFSLPGAGHR